MPRLETKGSKLMRRTIQLQSPTRTKITAPSHTRKRQKTQQQGVTASSDWQSKMPATSRTAPLCAAPSTALSQIRVTAAAAEEPARALGKEQHRLGPVLEGPASAAGQQLPSPRPPTLARPIS